MSTPGERARRRSGILEFASGERRITGGAITGSAASGREDRWSDIDLAFGVREASDIPRVRSDWTAYRYAQHKALHHLVVTFGAWTYRVFLLRTALQVDLAFVPQSEFRALTPAFHIVFGKPNEPGHFPIPSPAGLIAEPPTRSSRIASTVPLITSPSIRIHPRSSKPVDKQAG